MFCAIRYVIIICCYLLCYLSYVTVCMFCAVRCVIICCYLLFYLQLCSCMYVLCSTLCHYYLLLFVIPDYLTFDFWFFFSCLFSCFVCLFIFCVFRVLGTSVYFSPFVYCCFFPISLQFYRLLPLGGNLFALKVYNKYHISCVVTERYSSKLLTNA
jgi:hypothetical protein